MDDESARTVRRLENENAALRDANEALTSRLARFELELPLHAEALPQEHDALLAMAYDELERQQRIHLDALEEVQQIWQETCYEIDRKWKKSFDDSNYHWILNYHRSRGKVISMAIFFVVLAYGIAVVCAYLGAEMGLEAALMGRSLEFSFVSSAPIFLVLVATISWRIWHWRHTPIRDDQDT